MIDVASGGALPDKTHLVARNLLIENMPTNSQQLISTRSTTRLW